MKIAVIGSGISGLSAAYYLSKKHKVDLFEKEDRFGGHSHTLEISTDIQSKKKIRTDIGFIVFNKHTYPNLINFFSEIGIEIEKSNMSLSFSVKEKNLEYTIKQSKKFLEGKSPPDFAPEDYEINYKGRIKLENLSNLAKKQLALE